MANKFFEIIAHACDKRGRIIAVGKNNYKKTHPLQKHFADIVKDPHKHFLHAEIDALIKCKGKVPHSLHVYRYSSEGKMVLAKPCIICQAAIKAFGVSKVFYTTNNQTIEEFNVL